MLKTGFFSEKLLALRRKGLERKRETYKRE